VSDGTGDVTPQLSTRAQRVRTIRLVLYPVMFSADPHAEVSRVAAHFRTYPAPQRLAIVRDIREELAHPLLAVTEVERLESRSSESQLRAYLAAVIGALDARDVDRVLGDG
jgi:hypothetical protein